MARRLIPCLVVALFLGLPGCGSGRATVTGTVKYEDGSPVVEGSVIGEAKVDGKLVAVQGNIQKDGTFAWGGDKEGDGAIPGSYKVIVIPPSLSEYQIEMGMMPAVDGKFTKYDSSGLTFEVKPRKNQFDITVSKPKAKGK